MSYDIADYKAALTEQLDALPGRLQEAYATGWAAAKVEDAKIIQALANELFGLTKTLAPTKGEDER